MARSGLVYCSLFLFYVCLLMRFWDPKLLKKEKGPKKQNKRHLIAGNFQLYTKHDDNGILLLSIEAR